jgi:HSP20 family molecular chaperone IbpA
MPSISIIIPAHNEEATVEDVVGEVFTVGSFTRALHIPSDKEVDKVEVTYNKGVLNIILPKLASSKQARRRVEIKNR